MAKSDGMLAMKSPGDNASMELSISQDVSGSVGRSISYEMLHSQSSEAIHHTTQSDQSRDGSSFGLSYNALEVRSSRCSKGRSLLRRSRNAPVMWYPRVTDTTDQTTRSDHNDSDYMIDQSIQKLMSQSPVMSSSLLHDVSCQQNASCQPDVLCDNIVFSSHSQTSSPFSRNSRTNPHIDDLASRNDIASTTDNQREMEFCQAESAEDIIDSLGGSFNKDKRISHWKSDLLKNYRNFGLGDRDDHNTIKDLLPKLVDRKGSERRLIQKSGYSTPQSNFAMTVTESGLQADDTANKLKIENRNHSTNEIAAMSTPSPHSQSHYTLIRPSTHKTTSQNPPKRIQILKRGSDCLELLLKSNTSSTSAQAAQQSQDITKNQGLNNPVKPSLPQANYSPLLETLREKESKTKSDANIDVLDFDDQFGSSDLTDDEDEEDENLDDACGGDEEDTDDDETSALNGPDDQEGEEEVLLALPDFAETEELAANEVNERGNRIEISPQEGKSSGIGSIKGDGKACGSAVPVVTEVVSRFVEALLAKNSTLERETLHSAIQDCYGRFILNLPHRYLTNHIQLCFAIQESFWWYDDYWFERMPTALPKLSMRNFGFLLCEMCPLLRLYFKADAYATFMHQWRLYCRTIPLKGAILINNTLSKVLMVQSWRGGRWMFPRGKVDELEDDVACAIREVKEEIGVDVSNTINPDIYIETNLDEQPIKLYLVPGVLETTPFGPRKRKEIGQIRWISVEKLPGWNRHASRRIRILKKPHWLKSAEEKISESSPQQKSASAAGEDTLRFWNVYPFVDAFTGWIDLLLRGSKSRRIDRITSKNSMTLWLQPEICSWPYVFPCPPISYNENLLKRYCRLLLSEGVSDLTNQKLLKHPDDQHFMAFHKHKRELLERQASQCLSPQSKKKHQKKTEASSKLESSAAVDETKHVGLSSISVSQPAAAKACPLPPFIDEYTLFRVPVKVSLQKLKRLQHPNSSQRNTNSVPSSERVDNNDDGMGLKKPDNEGQRLYVETEQRNTQSIYFRNHNRTEGVSLTLAKAIGSKASVYNKKSEMSGGGLQSNNYYPTTTTTNNNNNNNNVGQNLLDALQNNSSVHRGGSLKEQEIESQRSNLTKEIGVYGKIYQNNNNFNDHQLPYTSKLIQTTKVKSPMQTKTLKTHSTRRPSIENMNKISEGQFLQPRSILEDFQKLGLQVGRKSTDKLTEPEFTLSDFTNKSLDQHIIQRGNSPLKHLSQQKVSMFGGSKPMVEKKLISEKNTFNPNEEELQVEKGRLTDLTSRIQRIISYQSHPYNFDHSRSQHNDSDALTLELLRNAEQKPNDEVDKRQLISNRRKEIQMESAFEEENMMMGQSRRAFTFASERLRATGNQRKLDKEDDNTRWRAYSNQFETQIPQDIRARQGTRVFSGIPISERLHSEQPKRSSQCSRTPSILLRRYQERLEFDEPKKLYERMLAESYYHHYNALKTTRSVAKSNFTTEANRDYTR